MRITIDLTPTLLRSAGVKNHLFYWVRALQASRGERQLDFYPFLGNAASRAMETLDHDRGLESGIPNWRLFLAAAMNWPPTHPAVRAILPGADVFHGSPQLRLPPRTRRLTSHIHDLTCWLMPELHTRANAAAARQIGRQVWAKADGLIAVSASARDDAVRLLGLDPARIEVIHHGVPDEFFSITPEASAPVLERYSLRLPYVLAVGTIEPRKNLDRLLNAWASLPGDVRDQFSLVVAGPAGWKSEATLTRLASGENNVRYLGYVPEADLPALTAAATALAYPSLYEGFGFPVAQAMASGTPSLTSDVSSLPEVAAGSAILIDPRSEAEIRDGLESLLTSPTLRDRLGRNGRAHALTHYRWELAAQRSWRFFERVSG